MPKKSSDSTASSSFSGYGASTSSSSSVSRPTFESDRESDIEIGRRPKKGRTDWIKIGKVKNLIYYPIDSGYGYQSNKALCTINGLIDISGEEDLRIYKDRCLIVYDESKREAVLKPEVAKVTNFQTDIKNLLSDNSYSQLTMKINYLNTGVSIKYDLPENVNKKFEAMFSHSREKFKIGYVTPIERLSLVKAHRFNLNTSQNNAESFLGNYSHYTLINNTSVDDLRKKFKAYVNDNDLSTPFTNITYKCFSPQIVIEAAEGGAYCEDNVEYVKIGTVEFDSIIPCVHTNRVTYNWDKSNQPFIHLHTFLKSQRLLSKNEFNLPDTCKTMPRFGINMERMKQENRESPENDKDITIKLDDEVFVKYKQ